MSSIQCDVCIIGSGIIGKAAALGLAQIGLKVTLLETTPHVNSHDLSSGWNRRVYALNQAARSLLSKIKVWSALDLSRITAVEGMNIYSGTKDFGRVTFSAYDSCVDALAWIVEDNKLNQALDTVLKFTSNINMLSGSMEEMCLDNNGITTLQLKSGEIINANLIVGADGAHSWVRNQCQISIDYRNYMQRGVVTNFFCEKPHHGIAHQWFIGNEGIVALLPLPGKRISLVWSAPNSLASELLTEQPSELACRLNSIAGKTLGNLEPIEPNEPALSFPLFLLRTHALIAQNVALIGDAGHVIHPLAGHGMNLGFGDIISLIQVLENQNLQCGNFSNKKSLARYARMRKEEILLMQTATDFLEHIFRTDCNFLRFLRDDCFNILDRIPGLKNMLVAHALGSAVNKNIT